jgi:hypothetical protein
VYSLLNPVRYPLDELLRTGFRGPSQTLEPPTVHSPNGIIIAAHIILKCGEAFRLKVRTPLRLDSPVGSGHSPARPEADEIPDRVSSPSCAAA